ncbi:MAG: hypothetical protein D6785_00865 [Planctomycetota bacterium]|nr:MAG: hypothetical protein D6785_00865 [Planctomycetota bacterium]
MDDFKILLQSVENPQSPHLIEELATCLSIDEETSQSIIQHTPIILLDQLSLEIAGRVKERLKRLVALGAQLVVTDENLEFKTPRVNWPEDEIPEIVQEEVIKLGEEKAAYEKKIQESQKEDQSSGKSPAIEVRCNGDQNILICPGCQKAYFLQPLSEEHLAKLGFTKEDLSSPSPASSLTAGEKKETNVPLPKSVEQESSLDIEGLEISEEKVLTLESSSEELESVQTERPDLIEEEFLEEESTVELEPEEQLLEFDSQIQDFSEDLKKLQNQMEGPIEEEFSPNPVKKKSNFPLLEGRAVKEDFQEEVLENSNPVNPKDETLLTLEKMDQGLEDDEPLSFEEDDDIEEGGEDFMEMEEDLHEKSGEDDSEPAISQKEETPGEGDEEIPPLLPQGAEDRSKGNYPNIDELGPASEFNEEALSSADLSLLDSVDGIKGLADEVSDEILLEELLPLYEISTDPIPPEEALEWLQKNKTEIEESHIESGGQELQPLSPEEAMALMKGAFASKSDKASLSKGSSQTEAAKDSGKSKAQEKASSLGKAKFQKLETKKRKSASSARKTGISSKVLEGTGTHGVVLSRIMSEEKKEKAAKIIAEIKNIPLGEAKKMTEGMIIPVLRGVQKEVADEVSNKFKSAGISVRVVSRKQ